jgi:hypothetical protein
MNAFEYAEKRGYLENFSSFMRQQDINIIECRNTGLGSKYNCGFQVLSWIKNHQSLNQ